MLALVLTVAVAVAVLLLARVCLSVRVLARLISPSPFPYPILQADSARAVARHGRSDIGDFLAPALGRLVSSQHAGLACVNWPACVGTLWFPTWEGLVGLHLLHRTTAYLVALSYVLVAVFAWDHDTLGKKSRIALALVFVQVAIGVANVLWQLPVEVTASHSAVAAMLCLTTGLMLQDFLQRPVGGVESLPATPSLGETA